MFTKRVWIILALAVFVAGALDYNITRFYYRAVAIEQNYISSNPTYSIGVSYPYFVHVNNEKKVNNAVKETIDKKIAQFKAEATKNSNNNLSGQKSALYIDYAIVSMNSKTVKIKFIISSYLAGDKEPNHYTNVVNYDSD